jgi:hypothetical protein
VDIGPLISVMQPRGTPPPKAAFASAIPVAKTLGACLILSVSAAGTRWVRMGPTEVRVAEAQDIFALYSL